MRLRGSSWLRGAVPHVVAVVVYMVAAAVVLWPLPVRLSAGLVGEVGAVDAYQNAWNVWWVAYAVGHGVSPFTTPLLFYPDGVDLFWQTLGLAQGLMVLPITLVLGPIVATNVGVVLGFVVSGYVTFCFARRLTGEAWAALVAGAVYAFSPFHMEKVLDGNLEVAAIQWVPCFLLALFLLLERPSWRQGVVSGVLLLWVSLGSWYYGLFCVLATVCVALIWAGGGHRGDRWRLVVWGMVPLVVWGVVLAPQIVRLALAGDRVLQDMRVVQVERSADALDFFLPSPVNPWWGPAVRAARAAVYPGAVIWNVALGWVGLVLGGMGVWGYWSQVRRWVLLLLASLVLALGPVLRVAGWQTGVPLPFALVQSLPGIRSGQRPNHMVVMGSVALALLAGFGALWLMRRFAARRVWVVGLVLVAAVVVVDGYAGPLRVVSRAVHPFYATLPPPDGGLLALPMYVNINRSDNLTPQMVHQWPILGGYVARPPDYPLAHFTPGVRELEFGTAEVDDIVMPGWPDVGRSALADYAIRYVVLDLTSDKEDYFALVRGRVAELGLRGPLVADSSLEAYAVPRDWEVRPFGYLGGGWQPLEEQPGAEFRWRWMGESASLQLYNPYRQASLVTVSLSVSSYQRSRMLRLVFDGGEVARFQVMPDGVGVRSFQFFLQPGLHSLMFLAEATPDPQRANMPISVRVFRIATRFSSPLPR